VRACLFVSVQKHRPIDRQALTNVELLQE